ncbi:hypothetical protein Tco_0517802 [Tanacetum coccineum]
MGIGIPQSNVLSHVSDEAITKEMHDGLRRATTTASSLEAEQGSGNISKTQTKATPSRLSSPRTSSEGTDIAKILRKWSNPGKHGHGNGRAHKEPGECYQSFLDDKLTMEELIGPYQLILG